MSQDDGYPDPKPQIASPLASIRAVLTRRVRLLAVATAVLTVQLLATRSGLVDQSNTILVVDGFDPDRAQLITSLLLGAVVAAAVTLATGRIVPGTVIGSIEAALLFAETFTVETVLALRSRGIDGAFDLGGWLLTAMALIMSGVISAWAGAGLASLVRPWIVEALSVLRSAILERRVARARLRHALAVAFVLALLVATVPVFGDLVNYSPDVLMRQGEAPPRFSAFSVAPADQTASPMQDAALQSPASSGTPPARPWLKWLPSGAGQITVANLAAPWRGGTASTVEVSVYTPPGYVEDPARTYPVLYEAPFAYPAWNRGAEAKTALDTLIDEGAIPATIAVFIGATGGPFPDTECANSFDGREWLDTFLAQTVVGWVDSHYRTIAEPAARSITGMSQGGYCAAILALHHPDVFGTAIAFSGYFQAGGAGADSGAPFGHNKTLIAAASPTVVAGQLDTATRRGLFFVVIAKPDQPGFGPQAAEFEKVLATNGYSYDGVSSSLPHGWSQVRSLFPTAVETWAAREVAEGVF